ncbi:unnamed protein product [Caenorhabditis brenneri]
MRVSRRLILLIFLIINAFFALTIFHHVVHKSNSYEGRIQNVAKNVTIFAATKYFGSLIDNSVLQKCPEKIQRHCSITNNVSLLATSDAVFFHSRDFSEETLPQYAINRQLHTPYVLMTQESPHHSYLKKYNNYFNWTMTYRKDSDVHFPYGALVERKESARINYTEIWRSKTKEALWLNANSMSHNQRTQLVKKLKEKGMDIDLMGPAHKNVPRDCPRSKLYEDCNIKLHSPYKFYIAFENSNCEGYVTEKFWGKAGFFNMIPIVMSRKIYREIGIPDSMYISIDDFPNLDQFVAHVKNVSNNETEYLKFHKWREDYRIIDINEEDYGYCQLCRKLMDLPQKEPVAPKSYEDMSAWHGLSNCDNSFAHRYL